MSLPKRPNLPDKTIAQSHFERTNETLDEVTAQTSQEEKESRKLVSSRRLGVVGAALVAILVVVGILLALGGSSPKDHKTKPKQVASVTTTTAPPPTSANLNTVGEPSYLATTAPPSLSTVTKASSPQIAYAARVLAHSKLAVQVKLAIPSAGSSKKWLIKNKVLNPLYTPISQNAFEADSTDIVERLLNPVYGGWSQYQLASSHAATAFDLSSFKALLTRSYYKAVSSNKSAFPVYADWKGNSYGLSNLSSVSPVWVGTIRSASVQFIRPKKSDNTVIDAVYGVRFEAQSTSANPIYRRGVLRLQFAIDSNSSATPLLISGGNLVVH